MKIATLICIWDGEVNGDVRPFNVDTPEGRERAIEAWKDCIREAYESDSEDEVLSKIEEGIINDFCWKDNGDMNSYSLYWGNLE